MPQIDPNIAMGIRVPQLRDPLEAYGNALAIEGAQQQNMLRRQQMETTVRERQEQEGFRNALRASSTRGLRDEELEQDLLGQGYVTQADALRKSRLEAKKTQATIDKDLASSDKDKQAIETQRGEEVAFFLRNATPETWPTLRGYLVRNAKSEQAKRQVLEMVPEQFDATIRDAMLDRTVKQLDVYKQRIDSANQPVMVDARGNLVPNEVAIAAKSRIAQAGAPVTYGSPVAVQLPGGQMGLVQPGNRAGAAPQVLTVQDATGARVPVRPAPPPPPKEEKATEAERSSAGYLTRMRAAEGLIGSIRSGEQTELTAVAGAIPGVGQYVQRRAMTPEQQRYKQASDDWIRAKLRKESGAVIGADEMKQEYITYFPQPGDTPDVIAQKANARRQAERQMEISAGKTEREAVPVSGARGASPGGQSLEDRLNKYR